MPSLESGAPSPNPYPGWTDPTITANITAVRKPHVEDLREYLEEMSGHVHDFGGVDGEGPTPTIGVNWGDDITADETYIRDDHWLEVRSSLENLDGHYHVVPGYSSPSAAKDIDTDWDPDPLKKLEAGYKILKQHITEVRLACEELYNHTHTLSWCSCVGRCDNNCNCNHQDTCIIHSW